MCRALIRMNGSRSFLCQGKCHEEGGIDCQKNDNALQFYLGVASPLVMAVVVF